MSGRALGFGAVLAGLLVLAVLAARPSPGSDRPLDPRAAGPQGARALVLLLEELGADVDTGPRPDGDDDTAVVLEDRLTDDGRQALRQFVAGGGVLVVADRTSPLALDVAAAIAAPCPRALADVEVLRFAPGPAAEVPQLPGCFGGSVRARPTGAGDLVVIDTPRYFTNDLLDEGDNAVLAAALLAPSGTERVAFITAEAGTGEEGLVDLVGSNVLQALAQLGVAAVVYVLWRGRRLGRPVAERQPVRHAGSELVSAVGRLLSGRRRPGETAAALRADARRHLVERLGLDPRTPIEQLVGAVVARTGLDPGLVAGALELRPVTTDDELVEIADAIDRILSLVLLPGGVST